MTIGIYRIQCREYIYIGSSVQIEIRWKQHIDEFQKGQHGNIFFQRLWDKYADSFEMSILEECPKEILRDRETWWIRTIPKDRRINISDSGFYTSGMLGRSLSPSSRKQMSISHTGKKHSEETRAKMSMSRRGKKLGPQTEETRQKISDRTRGKKHSDEAKEKMRDYAKTSPRHQSEYMSMMARKRWAKDKKD